MTADARAQPGRQRNKLRNKARAQPGRPRNKRPAQPTMLLSACTRQLTVFVKQRGLLTSDQRVLVSRGISTTARKREKAEEVSCASLWFEKSEGTLLEMTLFLLWSLTDWAHVSADNMSVAASTVSVSRCELLQLPAHISSSHRSNKSL